MRDLPGADARVRALEQELVQRPGQRRRDLPRRVAATTGWRVAGSEVKAALPPEGPDVGGGRPGELGDVDDLEGDAPVVVLSFDGQLEMVDRTDTTLGRSTSVGRATPRDTRGEIGADCFCYGLTGADLARHLRAERARVLDLV